MAQQSKIEVQYQPGISPEILSRELRDNSDLVSVQTPQLTVLTISFNTGKFLEDTIRSILNQSFRNFEHVVIDGGSTDGTIEILKKYPHIKWISEKDNGYPDAFRKGLRQTRGKYITQCAVSDGYANERWFEYCVKALGGR